MHVPYAATSGAVSELIAGRISLMSLPIASAEVYVKSGGIRIIGCTSKERFPVFKDVPSLYEQGLTGFDFSNWYGVWGPAGMSPDLVARYNEDIRAVLTSAPIESKFDKQGWLVKVNTPSELNNMAKNQLAAWVDMVATTKVKVN